MKEIGPYKITARRSWAQYRLAGNCTVELFWFAAALAMFFLDSRPIPIDADSGSLRCEDPAVHDRGASGA
jgi:hypothetical protein